MRACRMLYAVIGFIANTNMKLLWDVNGLACRTGAGPWSPECNATAMLGYIDSKYGNRIPCAATAAPQRHKAGYLCD